jgi:nucleotide-binding universal stress UspA family protein
MSFDVLLPLLTYPDPTPEVGLLRAMDFASTIGSRVTALAHIVDIPPITNPLARAMIDFPGMALAAEVASRDKAEELQKKSKHLAERFGLPSRQASLTLQPQLLPDRFAAVARTHDLTLAVVDAQCEAHVEVAQALLFGSGGPVVLFPGLEVPTHIQTVVIAWDGGRAAARAVRDALPILRRASQVAVATVSDDKPASSERIEALASFLNGHGIAMAHHDVKGGGRPVGQALQDDAVAHDAGLLVMGAYGHNRFREFVLGGATRSVLDGLRLPVFMSH